MGSIILSVAVVAVGVGLGLLRGGRIETLWSVRIRWWGLIAGGFVAQAIAESAEVWQSASLVVIGMFLLVVGLVANASIKGALIAAFGVTLNLMVFVLNGATPIRFEALEPAGLIEAGVQRAEISSVGHLLELETASTRLSGLGDTIPIGFLNSVISVGDLVVFAGVIVILSNLIGARRRFGVDVDDLFGPPMALGLDLETPTPLVTAQATVADSVVLDLADDEPVIDVSEPASNPRPQSPQPSVSTYDPDGLWADDDTGVRILGPSSTST